MKEMSPSRKCLIQGARATSARDYQNLVPTSRPSSSELPEIQDSDVSLEDALNSVFSSHEWSENPARALNMTEISTNIYQTTIPGHENCTWVTYKIIAYDNNGNQAINDNHGYYYIYHIIPEFPSLIILPLLMITTLLAVIVYKRKNSSN